MKTVTFEIDDQLVCSECGTNDQLHYHFYAYAHRSETSAFVNQDCAHSCDCGHDGYGGDGPDVALCTREEFLASCGQENSKVFPKAEKYRQDMLNWMEANTND